MLQQLAALAILRWRIARNTFSVHALLGWILTVVVFLGLLVFCVMAAMFGYALGFSLPPLSPRFRLGALDALAIMGCLGGFMGVAVDLQRYDQFDMRRLLMFPVPLGLIFGVNVFFALAGVVSSVASTFAIALVIGMHVRGGLPVVPGIAIVLGFVLALAAWCYHVRGWMSLAVQNKRRRRWVLTLAMLGFIASAQMPYVAINMLGPKVREGNLEPMLRETLAEVTRALPLSTAQLEAAWQYAHVVVPPLWCALALNELAAGRTAPALAAGAGLYIMMLVALVLAYRLALRVATGTAAFNEAGGGKPSGRPWTAIALPGAGEDTAALVSASFLGMLRHPQVRMLLLSPLIIGATFLITQRFGMRRYEGIDTGFIVPSMLLYFPFLNFSMLIFNQFGLDVSAFRALVLTPVPRHRVLFAKNLALFPFVGGMGAAFAVAGVWLHGRGAATAFTGALLAVYLFIGMSTIGNFASVLFPYVLARDPFGRQVSRGRRMLNGMGSAAVCAVLVVPAVLCMNAEGIFPAGAWIAPGVLVSVGLCGVAALAYGISLRAAGDLLLAREQQMLDTLARDRD